MFKIQLRVATLVFIIISVTLLFSCKSSELSSEFPNSKYRIPDSVNTKMNRKFKESRKSFVGKLDSVELKKLYNSLRKHLDSSLVNQKAILVNYKQAGKNCFNYDLNSLTYVKNNSKKISKRISKEYNIKDYFMYSQNAFNRDYYKTLDFYEEDDGFFKENIFTLEEVCEGFFLLKSNGEFLKFYGTDYFSEVINFMKSEVVFDSN